MGNHEKDKCGICGSQKDVTFISWIKNKDNTKGDFRCKKHELKEVSDYIQEK